MIWFVLAVAMLATGFDLWKREIPDTLSLFLVGVGLGSWFIPHDDPWSRRALLGAIGFSIAGIVTVALYALGGLGGGDVKLLSAIGLCLGIGILPVLLWTALAGAILAVVAAWRKEKEYAYAPAILAGVAVHALFPELLARISQPSPAIAYLQ